MIRTIPSLLGPTASGKTAAALALAVRRPIEIISVDSALVYRGMDIGTAKPTRNERAQIPHHLIDIRDPSDAYSVANFRIDTLRVINEIVSRGRTPFLVGGTMFYYKALIQGINDLPSSDPEIRAELDADAVRRGWPKLHIWLEKIDPRTAARIDKNDSQRIKRALEVFLITRKPMSVFLTKAHKSPSLSLNKASYISSDSEIVLRDIKEQVLETCVSHMANNTLSYYKFCPITLEPSNRSVLHERITIRFDNMLTAGFIEEVENLRRRADLHTRLPSIRCVGYRQVWEFLEGKTDYKSMRNKCIFATRQLCKHQLTWLRSIPDRIIVDCSDPNANVLAVNALERVIDEQV
ncbi:MAG: tRNA (adenosine(37)-N6)-dimethylallyltransferase MiaA [Burkholderia sp.]|nr:tRNA (adenosine(37)-N6)-dimethylallyltransferase MiaA [Burkholderia sp.]